MVDGTVGSGCDVDGTVGSGCDVDGVVDSGWAVVGGVVGSGCVVDDTVGSGRDDVVETPLVVDELLSSVSSVATGASTDESSPAHADTAIDDTITIGAISNRWRVIG